MIPINAIFEEVFNAAVVAINPAKKSLDGEVYRFTYTDKFYDVAGEFEVGGHWRTSGDNYETPIETEFVEGYAQLYSLSVSSYDNDYGGYRACDTSDVEAFKDKLNNALNRYMVNYSNEIYK